MTEGIRQIPGALVFFQEWKSVLNNVWDQLTREHRFGALHGSVATLAVGVLIFAAALL